MLENISLFYEQNLSLKTSPLLFFGHDRYRQPLHSLKGLDFIL